MTTASELIPSLIAQVLSRGLKEKLNPVYFSRLLLLAMNFSSWRNMESASEFSDLCVHRGSLPRRGETLTQVKGGVRFCSSGIWS